MDRTKQFEIGDKVTWIMRLGRSGVPINGTIYGKTDLWYLIEIMDMGRNVAKRRVHWASVYAGSHGTNPVS